MQRELWNFFQLQSQSMFSATISIDKLEKVFVVENSVVHLV